MPQGVKARGNGDEHREVRQMGEMFCMDVL